MRAEEVRQNNFTLYAVGIQGTGNNAADEDQLEAISGSPSTTFLISDLNQATLQGLEQALEAQVCGVQEGKCCTLVITYNYVYNLIEVYLPYSAMNA